MATNRSRAAAANRVLRNPGRVREFARNQDGVTATGPRYLIDNSVWARLATEPTVVAALTAIVDLAQPVNVLVCPPIALELGFSTQAGAAHAALRERLSDFAECSTHPSMDDVLAIQGDLWRGGLLRAAGAMDTLIAAYALANDAILVHYDRDFEHIAAVAPAFRHQWIVPRGSIT